MQRVRIPRAGSYEQLQIISETAPVPQEGEVRITAQAIGINYADCIVRMGLYESAKKYVGWPITPGFEVAGVVDAVGPGVTSVRAGDEVFAVTRFGGYATEIVLPAHQVFARPAALSAVQAATFPTVFLTAYFALFELANPRAGQTLLIHSASGGVGSALIQLGKIAECRVLGVVGGAHKVDNARHLGADVVIDKSSEALWPAVEQHAPDGCHIVMDANGVGTLQNSYDHLAAPGKLVVYGFHTMMPRKGGRPKWIKLAIDYFRTPRFNPLAMTGDNRSVLAFNLSYLFAESHLLTEGMAQLLAWVESGQIVAPRVTEYAFDAVADAHRDLESGQTVGKLVLVV